MRRAAVPRGPRQGSFTLVRHAPPVYVTNTAFGAFTVDGTNVNNLLQIGTPFAQPWGHDLPFSFQFTHANIINGGELTALFDVYRIRRVDIFATCQHNNSSATNLSGLPTLMWWPDPDNAAVETVPEIRERMGLRRRAFTADHRVRKMWMIHPRKMGAVFDVATGALNVSTPMRGWTDCDDVNIAHYGIKGMLENCFTAGTANVFSIRFDVRFTIDYRYAR